MYETLFSVGIDIGTSTTELVFTELVLDNTAGAASVPQIRIIDRKVRYRSEVHATPLRSSRLIDSKRIRELVFAEFQRAGMDPESIRTGAVIITGETARKENAREVLEALSGLAGQFVVATAGPVLEGIIAGKGAGAARESRIRAATVANLDIGGGTTNIALFHNGEVVDTACLEIGAKHIVFSDHEGRIQSVSEKMRLLTRSMGLSLQPGRIAEASMLKMVATRMVEILEETVGLREVSAQLPVMITDRDLDRSRSIDWYSFSGGVSDCIQPSPPEDPFAFLDLGKYLGAALAESRFFRQKVLPKTAETIWATVVGAGAHTVEVSGATITVSPAALPLRNMPVLSLRPDEELLPVKAWGPLITKKLAWFRAEGEQQPPALAFRGPRHLSFAAMQEMAAAIIQGMDEVLASGAPLVVVIERDFAKALGQSLRARLGHNREIVCIDGIRAEDGDYIDIGRELADGKVVPVVVKTLVFI